MAGLGLLMVLALPGVPERLRLRWCEDDVRGLSITLSSVLTIAERPASSPGSAPSAEAQGRLFHQYIQWISA